VQDGGVEVVEVQVDVVLLGAHSSAGKDLHGHGSADYISRSKVLSGGRISGHKTFSQSITKDTALASAAFGHEAASSIDAGGMELDELEIGKRQAGSGNHASSISGAGVGRGAGLVGPSVSSGGDNSVESSDSVDGAVSDAHNGDASADAVIVHDQVEREVLDEEGAVIGERASEEGVQHSVASSVSHRAGSVGLLWVTKELPLP
jgi:hypothetical protein